MRKGLTLMELLVVISILATLAALLYPVYLSVRTKMYAVSCANQLRQIGLAIKMYVHDQGDETPYSMPYSLGQLYPNYIHDKELLVCPYFRAIAPIGLIEGMHQRSQKRWKEPWSSYWLMCPKSLDEGWRRGDNMGFAPIFAKRGDATPIVFCDSHQQGCPNSNYSVMLHPEAQRFCGQNLFEPNAPMVILRWGGSVSLVHKPSNVATDVILMDY